MRYISLFAFLAFSAQSFATSTAAPIMWEQSTENQFFFHLSEFNKESSEFDDSQDEETYPGDNNEDEDFQPEDDDTWSYDPIENFTPLKKQKLQSTSVTKSPSYYANTPHKPEILHILQENGVTTPIRGKLRLCSKYQHQEHMENLDPVLISPISAGRYAEAGGSLVELNHDLIEFKKMHPHPIKSRNYNSGEITSDAYRFLVGDRHTQKNLTAKGIITPIKPLDYQEPYIPETEEERAARHEENYRNFLAAEAKRNITPKILQSIYEKEYSYFESYFEALNGRIALIDAIREGRIKNTGKSKDPRLTKLELEDLFDMHIAPHYLLLEHGNYRIFYSKETIDLNRVDERGRTNLERLQSKLCPLGHDGNEMNFHHWTRHDFATHGPSYGLSYVVLISKLLHTVQKSLLHLVEAYYRNIPSKKVDHGRCWGPQRGDVCYKINGVFKPI